MDDSNVEVLDEDYDVGSGVGSPDANMVQFAVDSQGDGTGGIDSVSPHPVMGVVVSEPEGCRFG